MSRCRLLQYKKLSRAHLCWLVDTLGIDALISYHFHWGWIIEQGLIQKTRQRSSRRIGGQNPCRASCFASAFLKLTVEFNRLPCRASCFASVFLKQLIEFNHLFQKDQGKTASAERILSPNPTRRPLHCLL